MEGRGRLELYKGDAFRMQLSFKHKKISKGIPIIRPTVPVHLRRFTDMKIFFLLAGVFTLFVMVMTVVFFRDEMDRIEPVLITLGLEPDPVLERDLRAMVVGYPIERMIPEIAKQDRIVAAYLVAIARKESQWGERVPVLDGRDCFNYWGYRGQAAEMGTDGHTCFKNPRQAVKTVARRLRKLVYEQKLTTPAELIVWKCGYSCASHSSESVQGWIDDVGYYFYQLNEREPRGTVSGASVSSE